MVGNDGAGFNLALTPSVYTLFVLPGV